MSLPANGAEIHRRCLAMRQALAQCSSAEVMAAVLADLVALWLAALPEPTRHPLPSRPNHHPPGADLFHRSPPPGQALPLGPPDARTAPHPTPGAQGPRSPRTPLLPRLRLATGLVRLRTARLAKPVLCLRPAPA